MVRSRQDSTRPTVLDCAGFRYGGADLKYFRARAVKVRERLDMVELKIISETYH